jgi:hypothetical protein
VFVFTLSPPIDYPSPDVRWEKFGKPISHFLDWAHMNFKATFVQYYQDQDKKMDRIDVCCFEPDEATGQKIDIMKNLDQLFNELTLAYFVKIYQFFKAYNTIALPDGIYIPQEKTIQERMANQVSGKPLNPKGGWPILDKAGLIDLLEKASEALSKSGN